MKNRLLLALMLLVAGVSAPSAGLAQTDPQTLESLALIDDYPLYTMTYYGGYENTAVAQIHTPTEAPAWGCSLFAAFADPESALFGRNFDWRYSPAVLLFTDPPDGYASVSMVDIGYLGFSIPEDARRILDLPLADRAALLDAPYWPFDGMNEHGLAVGMAAVPSGNMTPDPDKPTIDSLMVIRLILDHARTVDEAVAILARYNIDEGGGPPLHYLIAQRSGTAALVEFYQGDMHVIYNEDNWHLATNFIRAATEAPQGRCHRYDRIAANLSAAGGQIAAPEALDLLQQVAQQGNGSATQWSVVYGMGTGEIRVVMGQDYENGHLFHLPLAEN